MKVTTSENPRKRKVLTKKVSKKKKLFKDPFLQELEQKKKTKKSTTPSDSTSLPVPINTVKKDDIIVSRTASNKAHIARLLPKTRLQLPSHAFRPARTFAQCPSMSVVINEPTNLQQRQLPAVCSRSALNFHARRLGTAKRVDNDYRLGQTLKRAASKIKYNAL